MKRIITILVVCALFISSITSVSATIEQSESSSQSIEETETNYDFKTFKWGDTREHVIEIEGNHQWMVTWMD